MIHVIYRNQTRFNMAMDSKNLWLYRCTDMNTCLFNQDEALQLYMIFIFLPQMIVFYIAQLVMNIASYVVDGYLIYMLTMPFYW